MKIKKKRESAQNAKNHLKSQLGYTNLDESIAHVKTLIELSTSELLEKIKQREYSCAQVLRAFQIKVSLKYMYQKVYSMKYKMFSFYFILQALEVTEEFNCVTEFITEAGVSTLHLFCS